MIEGIIQKVFNSWKAEDNYCHLEDIEQELIAEIENWLTTYPKYKCDFNIPMIKRHLIGDNQE